MVCPLDCTWFHMGPASSSGSMVSGSFSGTELRIWKERSREGRGGRNDRLWIANGSLLFMGHATPPAHPAPWFRDPCPELNCGSERGKGGGGEEGRLQVEHIRSQSGPHRFPPSSRS
jgi:hypothetical protein